MLPLLLTGCAASYAAPNTEPKSCVDDGKPYEQKTLGERVTFLAAKDLGGRVPGSDGDIAARAFIAEKFACLGLTPAGDDTGFQQAFTTAEKQTTANVVGFIKGSDKEVGS